MIGILLVYFIGKSYYDLAGNYDKNKWGYAILGIIAYYLGTFIGGVIISIVALTNKFDITGMSDTLLGLMGLPLGVLSCWGLYKWLERHWSKALTPYGDGSILDEDLAKDSWTES